MLEESCICISQALQDANDRGALLNEAKWPEGEVIRAKFLEGEFKGEPALQERVKKVALEWTAPGMANVEIEFVESGETDVRITFEPNNRSWSILGTFCKSVPQDKATMNYGWLAPDTEDAKLRRVVLHEFGHVLGLIHEHQNPNNGIKWNEPAVIADCAKPPGEWDEATTRHNILDHYDPDKTTETPVDPLSIMMYPIPKSWTLDGFSAGLNGELSEQDVSFIKATYP